MEDYRHIVHETITKLKETRGQMETSRLTVGLNKMNVKNVEFRHGNYKQLSNTIADLYYLLECIDLINTDNDVNNSEESKYIINIIKSYYTIGKVIPIVYFNDVKRVVKIDFEPLYDNRTLRISDIGFITDYYYGRIGDIKEPFSHFIMNNINDLDSVICVYSNSIKDIMIVQSGTPSHTTTKHYDSKIRPIAILIFGDKDD